MMTAPSPLLNATPHVSLDAKLAKGPGKWIFLPFAIVLTVGLSYAGLHLFQDLADVPRVSALPFLLLGVALLVALGFEFVNGFHDTANAVATVIYTHSLEPHIAVVWSGVWNFVGVLVSTGAVAFGIIALLPVELILQVGGSAGFAMVFALLAAAIIWMYMVSESMRLFEKKGQPTIEPADAATLKNYRKHIDAATKFIPGWVKVAVALALGMGTMVGWKRIVVTVGEKIGKDHLTYAQGASAEVVAMATIGAADAFGLPVSTTHVLSSGVAGTMAANRTGLQLETVRNLLLAWVLTLPTSMLLAGSLFWLFSRMG